MKNEDAVGFFRQNFAGSWITQALGAAAELAIADRLTAGPRTADELAEETGSDGCSLYRLLRALASVGVFTEGQDGRFALTPTAELLRTGVPGSQRYSTIITAGEVHAAWGQLLHSVKTGEPGFQKHYGVSFFQYMLANPQRHAAYDLAMNEIHGTETEPMLDAYDFSGVSTVADIGGGGGMLLEAILRRHPSIRGTLFELPDVAQRAEADFAGTDIADRLEFVGGDFFHSVPSADALILRHVIHDWQDTEAEAILRTCRKAMSPETPLLVIETVLPPGDQPCFGKWLDLMMLLVGGRERTEEQYRSLFSAAGLRISRIVPTAHEVSVIEAVLDGN
jgi:hypothetical protein